MANQRAINRATRAREAAERAERRAKEAERAGRRRRRAALLRRARPRPGRRPAGVLAQRRRRRTRIVVAVAGLIQVAGAFLFASPQASLLVLISTVLALPVVLTLAFGRR